MRRDHPHFLPHNHRSTQAILAIIAGLAIGTAPACAQHPQDALGRLKLEPTTNATIPAHELLHKDAQSFTIACPGVPAEAIVKALGNSGKVPDDGYEDHLNAFVVKLDDGSTWTQRYARSEVDLCHSQAGAHQQIYDPSSITSWQKLDKKWVLEDVKP